MKTHSNLSEDEKGNDVIANEPVDAQKMARASRILLALQEELKDHIANGSGPFLAAIYNPQVVLLAKASNSVVLDNCSHCHAEMNAIKQAEEKLQTFDLSPYHLSLYVTSEPCLMCLGGIMWGGVKEVYYSVPSRRVEEITGFDEGFKPGWPNEFKKRGITVYGNIERLAGEEVLKSYVQQNRKIYKPAQ